ncbi:hypothetical protein ACS0PU_012985 [Formica fusca]
MCSRIPPSDVTAASCLLASLLTANHWRTLASRARSLHRVGWRAMADNSGSSHLSITRYALIYVCEQLDVSSPVGEWDDDDSAG